MSGKDKIESTLAIVVVGTFCYLTIANKIDATGFSAVAMYVLKKFLDGIEDKKKEE